MILESVLTCPMCKVSKTETMPTEYCQIRYSCTHCGAILKPNYGDCCVYCSYGSVKCPSKQQEEQDHSKAL